MKEWARASQAIRRLHPVKAKEVPPQSSLMGDLEVLLYKMLQILEQHKKGTVTDKVS